MEFNNTQVFNFEGAIRGMRNPLESWGKNDSFFGLIHESEFDQVYDVAEAWTKRENKEKDQPFDEDSKYWYDLMDKHFDWLIEQCILREDHGFFDVAALGPNDLGLAQRLLRGGNEHAKFMRQIFVSVDITAPIYWWKEMDTYKIGTTANSTSTMHKLTSKPITREMFEWDEGENLIVNSGKTPLGCEWERTFEDYIEDIIDMCERLRQKYIKTNDKRYWRALVQMLPQSWLQTRTWTGSYANLRNMYMQRRNHKLIEWNRFCEWVETLPYSKELIMLED